MTGGAMGWPGDPAWLLGHAGAWALVLARVLGLAWTAPALSTPGLDARIRLVLAAALVAVLAPALGPAVAAPASGTGLVRACLAELLVGAALGWSAALVVAGARQAGEIVGAQAGLSPSALFDPDAGDDLTPLGHLYGLIALAAFLALDGPLALVRALAESYRVLPAGGMGLSADTAALAFGRVGRALELSLRAAAPVALALALAGTALGLLGRAAPSLPVVALSLPARAALGVALALLGLATLAATVTAAWGQFTAGF
jgi:flagellar biosynthesis protein FliR